MAGGFIQGRKARRNKYDAIGRNNKRSALWRMVFSKAVQ
jgi:hypothetical protein